jgi:hypothetical protein
MKYTCPISLNTIDHNVVRLTSFFTLILISITTFQLFGEHSHAVMLFLVLDFLARIHKQKFSLLKYLSVNILHGLLKIPPKEIGSAPKKFAAGIGVVFAILIFVSSFFLSSSFGLYAFYILSGMFAIAVSLEAFIGFCVGCLIYSIIQSFK